MLFLEKRLIQCCKGNNYYFLHLSALSQAVAGPAGPKGERVSHGLMSVTWKEHAFLRTVCRHIVYSFNAV